MGTEPSEWAKQEAHNVLLSGMRVAAPHGTTAEAMNEMVRGLTRPVALALDAAQRAASVRVVRPIITVGEGKAGPCGEVKISIDGTEYPVRVGQSIDITERRAEDACPRCGRTYRFEEEKTHRICAVRVIEITSNQIVARNAGRSSEDHGLSAQDMIGGEP